MTYLQKLFYTCAYTAHYETAGDDVNYAFIEEDNTLYIYFQGSSSTTDWIRNFLFGKRPYKDMEIPYRVHRGFLAAWKEVEDIIIEKIINPEYQNIVIVGYSHGGALAAFCHECVWFYRKDLRENGLVTYAFEAPRIYAGYKVKKELKERWKNCYIIRNNNDIVTHCPPSIFSYCHVGNLVQIHGSIEQVKNRLPKCIKAHYPQSVYDGLKDIENDLRN